MEYYSIVFKRKKNMPKILSMLTYDNTLRIITEKVFYNGNVD